MVVDSPIYQTKLLFLFPIDMPEHNQGQLGGTMRLGKRQTIFKTQDSIMRHLYGNENTVEERHRHRYEVNPAMIKEFEDAGMTFVGHDSGNFKRYLDLSVDIVKK